MYVARCERDAKFSIDSLYKFMDGQVDAMNKEERRVKLKVIQYEFQEMYDTIQQFIEESTDGVSEWDGSRDSLH